jgi:hypothetical protein
MQQCCSVQGRDEQHIVCIPFGLCKENVSNKIKTAELNYSNIYFSPFVKFMLISFICV